jgi:hypothetical protein
MLSKRNSTGLGEFSIEPSDTFTFVKSWVPDLGKDIVLPLKAAGYTASQIAALGGVGSGNDFQDILLVSSRPTNS